MGLNLGMSSVGDAPGGDFSGLSKPSIEDFVVGPVTGSGAFCAVHKALYTPTGKSYALKVINRAALRRLCHRSPSTPLLLLQEKYVGSLVGEAMGVRLHCSFQDATALYFVYDWANGGELWGACMGNLLRAPHAAISPVPFSQGRGGGDVGAPHPMLLDEGIACSMGAWLARAVTRLHSMGVAHRDIKPENILLKVGSSCGDGDCKAEEVDTTPLIPPTGNPFLSPCTPALTDWGTSKVLHPPENTRHNFPGECVGTLEYMAPESADNGGVGKGIPSDSRADLWSFGCTIGRMLCGVSPFHAASPYLSSCLALAHEQQQPQHPCITAAAAAATDAALPPCASPWDTLLFSPGVSSHGEAFVRGLLRRDPAKRLSGEKLLSHPWLADVPPLGSTGTHLPTLKHLALCAAAHRIATLPTLPLPHLAWAMGRGDGDQQHTPPTPPYPTAHAREWRELWLQLNSPGFPHPLRLHLYHTLCLARRTSAPHIHALFCTSLGGARCSRALALYRPSTSLPTEAALKLGYFHPREAVGWGVAPEGVFTRAEAKLLGLYPPTLPLLPPPPLPLLQSGSGGGNSPGEWQRVQLNGGWKGSDSPPEEGGKEEGGGEQGQEEGGFFTVVVLGQVVEGDEVILKATVDAINRMDPPPRAVLALGDSSTALLVQGFAGLTQDCVSVLLGSGGCHLPMQQSSVGGEGGAAASTPTPSTPHPLLKDADTQWGAWLGLGVRVLFHSSPTPSTTPFLPSSYSKQALGVSRVCATHTVIAPGVGGGVEGRDAWEASVCSLLEGGSTGTLRYVLSPCCDTLPREVQEGVGVGVVRGETVWQDFKRGGVVRKGEGGGARFLRVPSLGKCTLWGSGDGGSGSGSSSGRSSDGEGGAPPPSIATTTTVTTLALRFFRDKVCPGWISVTI